jgi:outer membrane biosynthesis protein TonB
MGKRDAREELEQIEGISEFVVEYVFLTALNGHAIPLTESMIKYLKGNELVEANASRKDIEGFLSRIIRSDDAYEFYHLLRTEARKNPPKEKAKKKSAKKKSSKKKSKKKSTKTKKKKSKSKKKSSRSKKSSKSKKKKTSKKKNSKKKG